MLYARKGTQVIVPADYGPLVAPIQRLVRQAGTLTLKLAGRAKRFTKPGCFSWNGRAHSQLGHRRLKAQLFMAAFTKIQSYE